MPGPERLPWARQPQSCANHTHPSPVHEAFFFGPTANQVFAIYHPPSGVGSGELVVICPPLFSEYMRTHLALRELAISLAERGRHVIRLDYRGTGDSSRELEEMSVSDWVDDIVHAVCEGRDLTGSHTTRLIGVRAAALLACRAAQAIPDLGQVIMWDPVPSGSSYLETRRALQRKLLGRNRHISRDDRAGSAKDYAGYRLSPRMVAEFEALGIHDVTSVPPHKLRVVRTTAEPIAGTEHVRGHAEQFACNWDIDGEDLMMPQPVLERMISCVIDP